MKHSISILSLLIVSIFIAVSCSDAPESIHSGDDPPPVTQNFTVNIDGETWLGDTITAVIDEESETQIVSIIANTSTDANGEDPKPAESFVVKIMIPSTESLTPGDYFGSSVLLSLIIDIPGQAENLVWESETAEVLIQEVETEYIKGIFYGTLHQVDDSDGLEADELIVTDGEFSSRFH